MRGTADILGLLDDGTFLAVEVKSEKGRLSPEQKVFLSEVKLRGALAIVARSVEDVEFKLKLHLGGQSEKRMPFAVTEPANGT